MRHACAVVAIACALAVAPAAAQGTTGATPQAKWQQIDDDDGIRVWQSEVPGIDLPGFRGEALFDAEPREIIAVLDDWKRHTEWMHRCAESTLLKKLEGGHLLMYNRTSTPWPVWDRDVILETHREVSSDGKTTVLKFHNVKSALRPVPEKTVRMPRLVGFYKLVQEGPRKTRVTYQVEADPGGSLPRWLALRVARDLPFKTLSQLRDRVRKMGK